MLNATLAGSARVTESAMLKDKITGEDREVDVLISTSAAGYDVLIGIEVVSWSRAADTPWVEKMMAKHESLDTDRLILVSESGFTGPAKIKAAHCRVEALTIEEAYEADWPLLASLQRAGLFQLTTLAMTCSLVCCFENGRRELIPVPSGAMLRISGQESSFDSFVRGLVNLKAFRSALYQHIQSVGEHDFWFSYSDPRFPWKIDHEGRLGEAVELRVGLKVTHSESPVTCSKGRFNGAPFVSGVSSAQPSALQFVLALREDGSVGGMVVDHSGVRTLEAD